MHCYYCNNAVQLLTRRWINNPYRILKTSKSTCILSNSLTPWQLTYSGRRMVPEISHNKGNHGGFKKPSFQRFLHCTPFSFLSSSMYKALIWFCHFQWVSRVAFYCVVSWTRPFLPRALIDSGADPGKF